MELPFPWNFFYHTKKTFELIQKKDDYSIHIHEKQYKFFGKLVSLFFGNTISKGFLAMENDVIQYVKSKKF